MRKITGFFSAAAVAAALVVSPTLPAPSAEALTAGLGFTADNLPTWQANGTVWAVAAAGDVVFAGGTFTEFRPPEGSSGSPIAVSAFASFNAATGQPTSCRPAITFAGGTATVRALDLSPDGSTLYIGGNFSNVGGTTVGRLAALDIATCTVKTSFRPSAISSTVRAVSATNDTVYFAGDFLSVAGETHERFAAVRASNAALLPFTANAELPGYAIEAGADGSVAIGGDFFTVNGQDSHGLAIVDGTTGDVIQPFPRGFIPNTSVIRGTTADSTGYYFGAEGTGGGVFDGSLSIDYGTYAQRWRDLCLGATQDLLVDNGVIYEANHHHDCGPNNRGEFTDGMRVYLTANKTDATNEMLAWRPQLNDGLGEGIGPRSLAVAESGSTRYLWVGGEFTLVNGSAQQSLTRFANGPDTGSPLTPTIHAQSVRAGEVRLAWRASFDSDDGNLTYAIYRNGSSTPLATVDAESRWWARPQVSYVDTDVTPGQTYSYRVRASDGTNVSSLSPTSSAQVATESEPYAAAVLGDGAELYWRYDDASGRYGVDTSAGGAQVNYMQNVTYQAGENAALDDSGSSMGFDGSTAYAIDERIFPGPTTYSVETWINTTTTRGGKIVGFGDGRPHTGSGDTRLSSSYDRHVYMTNDGRLVFGAYAGGTQTVTSSKSYNDGEWHHIVATQGASGMVLYIDGVRVGKNSNAVAQSYWGAWRVGGDNLNGWPSQPSSNFFAGLIDETAVYPTVLSSPTVEAHYLASGRTPAVQAAPTDAYGAAVYSLDPDLYWRLDETSATTAADSGRYGVTGTYAGRVTTGTPGAIETGTAATFTPVGGGGNDGGAIGSDVQFTNPLGFSLELWFSTTSSTGGKLIGFGNQKTSLSSNYDRHVYARDDGRLVFGVWTGRENTITSADGYNDGAWHHLVATQSVTDGMSLYVDGELVGTNPQTAAQSYTGYWRVGGDTTWSGSSWPWFTGNIDEVAVYSSVLTENDVLLHQALGTGGTPPDAESPTAPTGATATANGDTTVDLTWEASTDNVGVIGYQVHRSTTAGFTPSEATLVTTATGTSYSDTGLEGGTYYYQIIAVDAAGNASEPSGEVSAGVIGPDVEAPSVPGGVSASQVGDAVAVSWSASTDDRGVAGYSVYRSVEDGFVPSEATKVADVTGTSFDDASVAAGTYFYVVTAFDATGNVSGPSAQASVEVLGPDVEAPSVPGGLSAVVSGADVAVSWSASTDDRGVAGYSVFRGDSAGFEIGSASQVGEVTGTSFTDAAVAPGTYYYKVTAFDASGNVSAASDAVSATVDVPPAEPVTVELSPTADAMVLGSNPNNNYGSSNQLAARGGVPQQESFLAFDLPVAPAGMELSSAVLSVRTSTDPTAGTVNDYVFSVVDGVWTEGGVTWNNRPTGEGTLFATLSGATSTNRAYEVTGDPAALVGSLGGSVTLRLAGASSATDNVRLWSREATNASYRPTLTLTYSEIA